MRYRKQIDLVQLKQSQEFEKLGKEVQLLVAKYQSGYTKVSDLIRTDILLTRDHTTKETARAENSIKEHVTREILTIEKSMSSTVAIGMKEAASVSALAATERDTRTADDERHKRFLQSLKFPAMNERRNQVTEPHGSTFRWIFDVDDSPDNTGGRSSDRLDRDVDDLAGGGTDDAVNNSSDDGSRETLTSGNDELEPQGRKSESGDEEAESSDEQPEPHIKPWDSFTEWLKSDSDIYWISGKPGSGKSTLVKFIVDSPLTKDALNTWRPDTLILSHFLWKPGFKMQNNIKGLLCSLLHQVLLHDGTLIDYIVSRFNSVASKDSDTDWPVKELKSVLLGVLEAYSSALCVFVDGLDEVSDQDGAIALMDVINNMGGRSNVKVCVASRPEPRFQARLRNYQQLRMQDLTENDMREYATEQLQPFSKRLQISTEFQMRFISNVVFKAEGVFLWLRLAMRSLIG
jgi:hypothetical protein